VDVEIGGDLCVDLAQEGQELGRPVARVQGADDIPGGEI